MAKCEQAMFMEFLMVSNLENIWKHLKSTMTNNTGFLTFKFYGICHG